MHAIKLADNEYLATFYNNTKQIEQHFITKDLLNDTKFVEAMFNLCGKLYVSRIYNEIRRLDKNGQLPISHYPDLSDMSITTAISDFLGDLMSFEYNPIILQRSRLFEYIKDGANHTSHSVAKLDEI